MEGLGDNGVALGLPVGRTEGHAKGKDPLSSLLSKEMGAGIFSLRHPRLMSLQAMEGLHLR